MPENLLFYKKERKKLFGTILNEHEVREELFELFMNQKILRQDFLQPLMTRREWNL
jgi:hypothetical protein